MKIQFQFSLQIFRLSRHSIIISGILFLSLVFSACSTVRLQINQFNKKESTLPRDMKTAVEDSDVAKKDSFVITVENDSGTFSVGEEQISGNQLSEKIKKELKDKSPIKRIVYIKAAESVKFKTLVLLFKLIRKADIEKSGLVVIKAKNEKPGARPTILEVKFPAEHFNDQTIMKPNPLTLVVGIDKSRNLSLNTVSMGNVNDTNNLTDKLTTIFKERENNGVFREGTNETEKTTFIKASQSLRYGDVAKVIDAVRLSGAQPVGMQLDDLSD